MKSRHSTLSQDLRNKLKKKRKPLLIREESTVFITGKQSSVFTCWLVTETTSRR